VFLTFPCQQPNLLRSKELKPAKQLPGNCPLL
jgi:hypothetical protein